MSFRLAELMVVISSSGHEDVMGKLSAIRNVLLGMPAEGSAVEIWGERLQDYLKEAAEAFEKSEQSLKRLGAIARATGDQLGFSRHELAEMANSLQDVSGFNSTSITDAMGTLARFPEIKGETFARSIKAATDLAAAGMGDVGSSAMAIGRALENPAHGMMMLSRAGVILSQSQRDYIEGLVKSGKLLEAQNVLLSEIERTVGGTAAAMKTPSQDLANTLDRIKVMVGSAIAPSMNEITETMVAILSPAIELEDYFGKIGEDAASWLSIVTGIPKALAEVAREGLVVLKTGELTTGEINKQLEAYQKLIEARGADRGAREQASADSTRAKESREKYGKQSGMYMAEDAGQATDDRLLDAIHKGEERRKKNAEAPQTALDEKDKENDRVVEQKRARALRDARLQFAEQYGGETSYDVSHGHIARDMGNTPETFRLLDQYAKQFGEAAMKALVSDKGAAKFKEYQDKYGKDLGNQQLLAGNETSAMKAEDYDKFAKAEEDREKRVEEFRKKNHRNPNAQELAALNAGKLPSQQQPARFEFSSFDQFAKSIQSGLAKEKVDPSTKALADNAKDTAKNTGKDGPLVNAINDGNKQIVKAVKASGGLA